MSDLRWWMQNFEKTKISSDFFEFRNTGVFWVAEHESGVKISKFKMVDARF